MRPRPDRVGQPPAVSYEAELARALAPMVRQIRATLPQLHTLGDVRALGAALRKRWSDKRIRALAAEIATRLEARAGRAWAATERAVLNSRKRNDAAPYDPEKLVETWARKAADMIASVRDDAVAGLRRDVVRALRDGTDPAELAAKWRREGIPLERGTLEGRVQVIAQHQLATLHAEVHAERARAVGVRDQIWRTQGDAKVRDEHRALEGVRYPIDDPPGGRRPGQDPNCRCYAESVIPDELFEDGPTFGSSFD